MSADNEGNEPSASDSETDGVESRRSSASTGAVDLSSTEVRGVVLFLLAGLVVRLLYVALVRHDPLFFSTFLDADVHRSLANSILGGNTFWSELPDRMPFYAYFNSLLIPVFGDQLTPVYVVQTLAGLSTAWFVFVLGRTLFGNPVGFLGMVLILFHPDWIVLETRPVPTVWIGFFVALGVLGLVYAVRSGRPRWKWLLISSFSFALAAGAGGQVFLVLPVLPFWFVFCYEWTTGERIGAACAWAAPILLFAGGILFLNHQSMVRSHGSGGMLPHAEVGRQIYAGTGPGATGYPVSQPGLRNDRIERMASGKTHPLQQNRMFLRKTWKHVRNNPAEALKTALRKLYYLATNYSIETTEPVAALKETSGLFPVDPIPFGFFVVLGGIGLLGTFRRGGAATAVSITVLCLFAGPMLTGASVRGRLPGVPLLSVLAGHGLMISAVSLLELKTMKLLWIVPVAAVCFIGFIPMMNVRQVQKSAYLTPYWRAKAEWKDRSWGAALRTLEDGRSDRRVTREDRLYLDYTYARYAHKLRTDDQKSVSESVPNPLFPLTGLIRNIEQRGITFPEAYRLMGRVKHNSGQHADAIKQFRKALRQRSDRDTWRLLGNALLQDGRYKEVIDEMKKAIETYPNCDRCRLLRARALGIQKKTERALNELKTVVERARERGLQEVETEAHFYAGYIYENTGRSEKAFEAYKWAQKGNGEFSRRARKRAEDLRRQIEQGKYKPKKKDD